jgi:outer membrane protein OmpA-like peptidoglycan-associated protein
MKKVIVTLVVAALAIGSISCSNWSKRDKGAAIGAGAGAVVGGVIGNKAGNTAVGAILGAVIGGAAGAYIGNQMDKQAEEMKKDLAGARIERVGEGIKITFESGILFDVDKSDVKSAAQTNLAKLATILNKYPDTDVLIEGHTDSTGSAEHNMELSIRRANSVGGYLSQSGVASNRFKLMGYGETQPIAANATADGRALNRRVEIAVFANDKLKAAAKASQG